MEMCQVMGVEKSRRAPSQSFIEFHPSTLALPSLQHQRGKVFSLAFPVRWPLITMNHTRLLMSDSTSIPDLGFGNATAHDPFQAAKASALKAAEELRSAAAQKANELRDAAGARATQIKSSAEQKAAELKSGFQEKAEDIRGYADDALGQAKERYETLMSEAENMAREKPRQALLTAFGVGLFVGLLLRR